MEISVQEFTRGGDADHNGVQISLKKCQRLVFGPFFLRTARAGHSQEFGTSAKCTLCLSAPLTERLNPFLVLKILDSLTTLILRMYTKSHKIGENSVSFRRKKAPDHVEQLGGALRMFWLSATCSICK